MLPILQIGPLAIQTPLLLLLLGAWLGLELVERQAALYRLPPGKPVTVGLIGLGAGIAGARLVYAAQNPAVFIANPLGLLALSPHMLSLPGGWICALAAGLAAIRYNRLSIRTTLDSLTAWFAVLTIALSLANFASGDAYGKPAVLPWSITLWNVPRHPAQVYEAIAAFLIFCAFGPWELRGLAARIHARPALRFTIFLAASAFARLFLESFRANSPLIWDQFRLPQVIAWAILALSLWQIQHAFVLPTSCVPSPLEAQPPERVQQ